MVVASIIKEREGDKIGKEEEAIEIEEIEAIEVEEIPDDDVQAIEDEVLMHRKSKQKGQLICDHCIAMFNNSQSLWLHKKKAHRVELSEERKRKDIFANELSAAKKIRLDDQSEDFEVKMSGLRESESEDCQMKITSGSMASVSELFTPSDLCIVKLDDEEEEGGNDKRRRLPRKQVDRAKSSEQVEDTGDGGRRRLARRRIGAAGNEGKAAAGNETSSGGGKLQDGTNDDLTKNRLRKTSKESIVKESEYFRNHPKVGVFSSC